MDQRSADWCHTKELAHLPALAVAASLVPLPDPPNENTIFYQSVQSLLAALWEESGTQSDAQIESIYGKAVTR